jgi:hypothetical protein
VLDVDVPELVVGVEPVVEEPPQAEITRVIAKATPRRSA